MSDENPGSVGVYDRPASAFAGLLRFGPLFLIAILFLLGAFFLWNRS